MSEFGCLNNGYMHLGSESIQGNEPTQGSYPTRESEPIEEVQPTNGNEPTLSSLTVRNKPQKKTSYNTQNPQTHNLFSQNPRLTPGGGSLLYLKHF